MIFSLTTVAVIYTGVRFYEHYHKRSSPDKKIALTPQNLLFKTAENKSNKHYVTMSGLSIGIATTRVFYPPLAAVSILAFTYTAIPYLRKTEKSLLEDKKIDGYVLYSIADMMMLGLGAYVSASVGIGLLHLSQYILSNAKEESKKNIIDIFSQQPEKVWLEKDGSEIQVPLDQIKQHDTLVVNAGDIIPVDGIIIEGIAAVDQKLLTGESQPSDKAVNDHVFASTLILSGHIKVRVEKSGHETTVAKIGEIINHSIEFKGDQELKGEKWADSFTLPILALGFLSWPIIGPAGAVAVLYCHIANTIRVVAPLGTLNHLNIAMKNGVLVKDGHVLEEFNDINTIIFDKTGTLTQETPEVGEITLCDKHHSKEDIIFYAASAEQKSVHPIAKAILKKSQDLQQKLPEIDDSSYEVGYGISVEIDGKNIHVGSQRFMDMKDIEITEDNQDKIDTALSMGHSVVMLAVDDELSGILQIQTIVRPEAKATIKALREGGITHIGIVSGDHELPTKALADALEIDDYFYNVLPEEKANIIEQLQENGNRVAIVGDGVNDTIAMEKADISISLNGASTVATDVAQVILMDGSLSHIPYLLELSKSLNKNLARSLVLNVVPNIIALNGVLFFNFGILTTMLLSQSPLVLGSVNALLPVIDQKTNDALPNKETVPA